MIGFESGNDRCLKVTYRGNDAGVLRLQLIRPGNDNFFNPCSCILEFVEDHHHQLLISWSCLQEGVRGTILLKKEDKVLKGEFSVEGKGHVIVQFIWELPVEEKIYPFIPAFMYGTNMAGNSVFATYPRLDRECVNWNQPWVSKEWLVRADRSSHCFTSVLGDKQVYAIGGSDISKYKNSKSAGKNGLGITIADTVRLTYSIGYVNVPYTYSAVAGRNYFVKPEGFVNLNEGIVESLLYIILDENAGRTESISMLLRESYKIIHSKRSCEANIFRAVSDIAGALAEYSYCTDAENFLVAWYPNDRINKIHRMFNTAWAGGLRTAYPLLSAGRLLGEKHLIQCACKVFDNIANNSLSATSGLLNENYDLEKKEWNARGWWYKMLEKPGHSAYVNGQAAYFLLLAWELEKDNGIKHVEWKNTVSVLLNKILSMQDDQGCFGYTFSEEDGRVLDRDGFCGCWFVPPLAIFYRISGKETYFKSAEKAMSYYRQYVEDFNVYGCPHDTFKSPDEEGILAWIESARILHEITGKEIYLRDLLMGLEYEFSWKFGYDLANEAEPLRSMNWSSTGGSVTSVNNAHIHPMGSSILYSMLYAWRYTEDGYILSRLRDTLSWSLQSYIQYEGYYGWGRKGMINERFCHTDSLLTERFADGYPSAVWFCYHSWAAGSVLEGLVTLLEKMNENEMRLICNV